LTVNIVCIINIISIIYKIHRRDLLVVVLVRLTKFVIILVKQ